MAQLPIAESSKPSKRTMKVTAYSQNRNVHVCVLIDTPRQLVGVGGSGLAGGGGVGIRGSSLAVSGDHTEGPTSLYRDNGDDDDDDTDDVLRMSRALYFKKSA